MKKENWLLIFSILVSLLLGLGLIRWLMPQLLGMPTDAKIIKLSKETPAFFETIFHNQAESTSTDFLINDPITIVRARPLAEDSVMFGPHDLLGFRNYSVPLVAPIITIGDSQTYGNNAPIDYNWPNYMLSKLDLPFTALYNMSTGGWGAVQYLNMFSIAAKFQPRVIIVAFYTGNDAIESFKAAYAIDQWSFLRPDSKLTLADMPVMTFPAPESEWWTAKFVDGHSMIFTPHLRFLSNNPALPAVKAGYDIIKQSALIMDEAVKSNKNVRLIFTIIPTKELVYANRIVKDGIIPSHDYSELISAESHQIEDMQEYLKKLAHSHYVNVIEPLQQSAILDLSLYSEDKDGHPLQAGYAVIGTSLAKALSGIQKPPKGIVSVIGHNKTYQLYLINQEGAWKVPSDTILDQNGWNAGISPTEISASDLALYPQRGLLLQIDHKKFGPSILEHN